MPHSVSLITTIAAGMGLALVMGLVMGLVASRLKMPALVGYTHCEEEAEMLAKENVGKVFMGEHELAQGMPSHFLAEMERA